MINSHRVCNIFPSFFVIVVCFSFRSVRGAEGIFIAEVVFDNKTLVINGESTNYNITLTNTTENTMSDLTLQAWVEQDDTRRASGGRSILCEPGNSQFRRPLFANDSTFGYGKFHVGPATAVIELSQGEDLLDEYREEIVLVSNTATITVFTGDANSDGAVNLADAIVIIGYMFSSGERPLCFKAADTNNDYKVNTADAINILTYMFNNGTLVAPDGTVLISLAIGCFPYTTEAVEGVGDTVIAAPACNTPCVP